MKKQITFTQLRRLIKESFDDEAPEVAYTVRNNARTFSHSDRPKEYGTYHTEEDAEKMRQWLAKEDPEDWNPKYTEVVQKDLDPMLPIHWSKVADLDESQTLLKENFTEEDFNQVDRMVDHAIENREQWEGGDVYGWLEDSYPDVDMRLITFATEIITDRLGLNESKTGKVKEAKKVKQPRYTIAQYCDMKGLDADKLMAAMKAHWSILSPPLTDRSMFLMSALDTYAERYADEMNADTPIEVQADDEAEDEVEVDVDEPYRDCGVMVHSVKGDREYGFKHFKDIRWFDSKEDMQHWLKCGCEETDGAEQDRFYSMLHQLERGIKVVDYNEA